MTGPFTIKLREEEENDDDNVFYNITYEDILIPFHILVINAMKECEPRSNLIFVALIWKYLAVVKFKMYAIVTIPLDTPKILYLKHHRDVSEGWITNSLCDMCFDEFNETLEPIISNYSFGLPRRCNLCLLH